MHKLLFLDIDGVLNRCGVGCDGNRAMIDPECVANLNAITRATGAKLVLSSSWRYMVHSGAMTARGFGLMLLTHRVKGELVGVTREDRGRVALADPKAEVDPRAAQVRDWLAENGHDGPYVAIDDDDDGFTEAGMPLVHTDGLAGLTAADAARAIAILNGSAAGLPAAGGEGEASDNG